MELALAKSPEVIRLDLGCGNNPKEGFEGVDLRAEKAKHKVDLFKFPFPWKNDSIDEIHCSHFVEHLPARDVEDEDFLGNTGEHHGKDFLFAFFDECWRILKHGSKLYVIVPSGRSDRAYQDPTHRRFIVAETFGYLNKNVRESMGLSHYNVECNFAINVVPTVTNEVNLRHPEVQAVKFREAYNAVHDWHATMITIKM